MKERIVVNPNIHFGKPCIANTRITVPCILELVKAVISFDEIKKEYYPDIEIDDIQACIQYAIDVVVAEDIQNPMVFLRICRSYGTKTVFVFAFYQYFVPDGTLQRIDLFCV